jgi:hypothetical protein
MSMGGLDPAIGLAENYRVWAREARGRSPVAARYLLGTPTCPRW